MNYTVRNGNGLPEAKIGSFFVAYTPLMTADTTCTVSDVCLICGGTLVDKKLKKFCTVCGQLCETCCDGGTADESA